MYVKKFSFCILLAVAASLIAWQSHSFSDTELLLHEENVAAIPEEEVLLSVQYGEGREFWIGNNTDQHVEIQGAGFVANGASSIAPGMFKEFILTGHPDELMGGSITVHGLWEEGGVKVESYIPQANMDFIMQELDEEQAEVRVSVMEIEQGEEETDRENGD